VLTVVFALFLTAEWLRPAETRVGQ
jgi:hypothetical protein